MLKFQYARAYIDSLKHISIHSITKERKEFQNYLNDESPDNHFQMLWIMITDMLDNPSNAVAESKKIYEFTLFTPKYDNIDLFSYFTEDIILSIYQIIKQDEKSRIYAYNSLVQILFAQKNPIAFSLLKKILTSLSKEIKNDTKSPLVSLADFYTKLEYMKLSIHKPLEITTFIKGLFQFLDQYQKDRLSSNLICLPIYYYYKIVKFVSKILNKNPEANPINLICAASFQPIILISYKLPNQIDAKDNDKIISGLPPLSIFQTYMPSEFPQFLIPYYYDIFFTIFEFFVIFANKPKPNNDKHDLQIITNTFNYVSHYESGKDAFLICLSFFKKMKSHLFILFRLYQYLEKKESSMIHDYCVMTFIIALDCHYLPHTRNLLKSNHKIFYIQILSSIEKNYQNSPFIQKVSFLKQILNGEFYIPPSMPLIQKYRLALAFNNYENKRELILKIFHETTKYLTNSDVYIYFCLLIINSIQKVVSKLYRNRFLTQLAFLVYSHDFFNLPRYHYLQILRYYAVNAISNSIPSFKFFESKAKLQNPISFTSFSIIYSRYFPLTSPNFQQIHANFNQISMYFISKIVFSECPHLLVLLSEVITSSVRYYKFSFDIILSYMINLNKILLTSPTVMRTRVVMRILAAVSTVDDFDKFISNYQDIRKLLEILVEIGEKNKDDIPSTPSFINMWRIIGSNQRKNEDLIASLILLSYNINKSRFFFESLFPVIINMSNPLLMNLKLDTWEQSQMFIVFIQCLPMNIKIYPSLQKYKEQKNNVEVTKIEDFKKKTFQPMPISTLATGITGFYFINDLTLID